MTDKLGFVLKNNNKRVLLLFHGLTGSPLELKQYAKKIHRAGYDVYCPTLPGHGQYLSEIQSIKWQDWLDFSLNKYLDIKNEYDEIFIGGICLGAIISLAMASEINSFSGVIALSTTLFLDGWTMPWYKFLFPLGLNTVFRYYYSFQEKSPYGIKNPEIRKKMLTMIKKSTIALEYIPMTCVYELLSLSGYIRSSMSEIKTPCLIAHSNNDDISSIKSARFVYKNISSKVKEFYVLEDSYHLLTMDYDKEFVTEKTINFLNRLSLLPPSNYVKGVLSADIS